MTGTMSPLLVLGATGTIGARLVARATADGRRTIAVARDDAALAALRERHGANVLPLAATLSSDADAAALAARVAALAGVVPGLLPDAWARRSHAPALAALGVRRVGTAAVADAGAHPRRRASTVTGPAGTLPSVNRPRASVVARSAVPATRTSTFGTGAPAGAPAEGQREAPRPGHGEANLG